LHRSPDDARKISVDIKLSKHTVQAIDEISAKKDKSRFDIMRMPIRKAIEKLEEEQLD
jgi:hypothetical protein